jgi:hypothetical protein
MSRHRLGINTCFAVKRWPEPKCWAEIVRDRLGLDPDHHWPFTRRRNATGRIEAGQALAALDASGASGTALILQVIPPFEQDDDEVVRELEESVAYWRAALARRR